MVQRQYSNSTIRSSRAEISRSTRPGPANRASAAITEVAAAVVAAATAGRSVGRAWARSFRFHGVRAVAVSTDCSADEMVDAFQGFKPPLLRLTSPAHRRFSGAMRKTRARAGLFVRRPAPEITRLGRFQGRCGAFSLCASSSVRLSIIRAVRRFHRRDMDNRRDPRNPVGWEAPGPPQAALSSGWRELFSVRS